MNVTRAQRQPKRNRILFKGRFLRVRQKDNWEYVERSKASGIVAILAITPDRKVILVEQFRAPLDKHVIELPAGLAGDIKGAENEALTLAARRELLEETGYTAQRMDYLMEGPPSAGLSTEVVTFFQARGLKKIDDGGGEGSEQILVHLVPLAQLQGWLKTKIKKGCLVDYKIYAALFAGQRRPKA